MEYIVISDFTDLQDDRYAYHTGDKFPRVGLMVSAERIAELSSANNRRGKPMIKPLGEVEEDNAIYYPEEPKKAEIADSFSEFMNPPEEPAEEEPKAEEKPKRAVKKIVVAVTGKPKRGRRKKTDVK